MKIVIIRRIFLWFFLSAALVISLLACVTVQQANGESGAIEDEAIAAENESESNANTSEGKNDTTSVIVERPRPDRRDITTIDQTSIPYRIDGLNYNTSKEEKIAAIQTKLDRLNIDARIGGVRNALQRNVRQTIFEDDFGFLGVIFFDQDEAIDNFSIYAGQDQVFYSETYKSDSIQRVFYRPDIFTISLAELFEEGRLTHRQFFDVDGNLTARDIYNRFENCFDCLAVSERYDPVSGILVSSLHYSEMDPWNAEQERIYAPNGEEVAQVKNFREDGTLSTKIDFFISTNQPSIVEQYTDDGMRLAQRVKFNQEPYYRNQIELFDDQGEQRSLIRLDENGDVIF